MPEEKRVARKYTDFTPEEIKKYLDILRKLILCDKYTISRNENRQENIDFIENYRIDSRKEKDILLSLQFDDFCYAADNEKEGFEHEKLYVFCKKYELDKWGIAEFVEIYIKTNVIETRRGDDYLVVISFHKRNKPITFLFKK